MAEVGPLPEEALRRKGVQALQRSLETEELLSFPRRPNGTALMLKQSLFERLLSGKTQLSSFPASDVSAAQGDLRHLSLEQLLALHATQGEAPTASAGSAMSIFYNSMETAMVERLAARLGRSHEVAKLVLLIYGAHQSLADALPTAEHWLLEKDVLLFLPKCELRPLDEGIPAYCHSNLIKAAASVPQQRRRLHWEVQLCEKPGDFKEKPRVSLRGQRPAPRGQRAGYPAAPKAQEAVSDEEATETETEDEAPKPGTRPRVVAAGLCSQEQARNSIQREGMGKPTAEELSNLQEELKLAKAAEVIAQEELSKVNAELQSSQDDQASMQEELSKLRNELQSARDGEALAEEELSKMKEEIKIARDAEASAQEDLSKIQEELKTARDAEDELAKLKEEIKVSRDAEASAQEELAKMQAELKSARDAEEELAKMQAELKSARDAEASAQEELAKMQAELKSARDAEAIIAEQVSELDKQLKKAEELEVNLREQLAEARTAEVSAETSTDLQWELMTAKDSEAQLKEQLAEAKAAEASAVAKAKMAEDRLEQVEDKATEPKEETGSPTGPTEPLSPLSKAKVNVQAKKTVDAALNAVASKDEDAESFASFESCEGGLVFRSPQKD